jgi:hypothetical protein
LVNPKQSAGRPAGFKLAGRSIFALDLGPATDVFFSNMAESDESDLRGMITIAVFRDLPDALLAQGSLDSAGIESHLADDNTVRMDWLWSNAVGGIKLIVNSEDVEAANEILNQPIPDEIDFEDSAKYEQPHCPKCQSLDINFEELYRPIAYGSLFVGFPLPAHRTGWTCHSCGHSWQDSVEPATKTTNTL